MKIAYYTSGLTGIGRIVHGISIYNAIIRKNLNPEFYILSTTPQERLSILNNLNIKHIYLSKETITSVSPKNYKDSTIYNAIQKINPDILIVDRMWFTLFHFIEGLSCKKIYLTLQVYDNHFKIQTQTDDMIFKKAQYDIAVKIEPFKCPVEMHQINPIIIKNHNEIMQRDIALEKLNLSGDKKNCFIGMNYQESYFEKLKDKYSYIDREEYDIIYSTNIRGNGIFPIADYYNAIDLIISSATYNHYWEARFFNKDAIFEVIPVSFCDHEKRLRECKNFKFEENGADQLVDIFLNL